MNKSKNSGQRLRKLAEERLRNRALSASDETAMSAEQMRQALYELRVHQIELELQNEELRRVQLELEASKAHYFDFYNLAPVGYCTISATGLLQDMNLTFAAMLAIVRSKLIHKPFNQFVWGADCDRYYLFIKKLFATGEPQVCELRLVKADQTTLWAMLTASRATGADGAPECRLVVSDISERKLSEEKNNYYCSLLLATFEASEEGIFAVDASRNLSVYNSQFCKMWNIAPAVLEGCNEKQVQELALLQIADKEKSTIEMRENYNKTDNIGDEEIRLVDGRILVRTIKQQKIEGVEVGRVLSFRDITERKLAEEHRAMFAANVSHQLLTPLAIINTYSEALATGTVETIKEAAYIGQLIQNNCRRMEKTMAALLLLTKMDYRPSEISCSDEFDLSAVLRGQLAESGLNYPGKTFQVTIEAPQSLMVQASEPLIEQIFRNLIDNAMKFTADNGTIHISLTVNDQGKIMFSISDSGPGIRAADLPRIYDRFFRGTAEHVRRTSGAGLGLAVVKQIVDFFDGTIVVHSLAGKGAEFVVTLPHLIQSSENNSIPQLLFAAGSGTS
ncbi:MAG: PAS domain-containing sensor histidine kinase [Bacillota bacterium]